MTRRGFLKAIGAGLVAVGLAPVARLFPGQVSVEAWDRKLTAEGWRKLNYARRPMQDRDLDWCRNFYCRTGLDGQHEYYVVSWVEDHVEAEPLEAV